MSSTITLTLQPDDTTGIDNNINSAAPDDNYGGETYLPVGESNTSSNIDRSLIKFDLSSIPSNATITSATLSLWIYQAGDFRASNNRTIRVYRSKRAWSESQSTWNSYSTGNAWQTAGASGANDREATDIGSHAMATTDAQYSQHDFTLTTSAIQEMITGGAFTNNGFHLQADTETDDLYLFASSAFATAGYRPKIVVEYTMPAIELYSTPFIDDANLKAYWRLGGNSLDETTGNHDGTDTSITYGTSYGTFGQGADFNGSTSKILFAEDADLEPSVFTICLWAKLAATADYPTIIQNLNYTAGEPNYTGGWFLRCNPDEKLDFMIAHGIQSGFEGLTSVTAYTPDVWFHVAVTFDGTTIRLYWNGIEDATDVPETGLAYLGTSYPAIGVFKSDVYGEMAGRFPDGSFDDIAIFNRALTADEVKYLYNGLNVYSLVVAGGGGGGGGQDLPGRPGGGGGAGGYKYNTAFPITAGTYAITVGDGGAGTNTANGDSGGNSIFSSITSTGGGGGGGGRGNAGTNGGSGGGGGDNGGAAGSASPSGEGNNGAAGGGVGTSGGGGGIAAAGSGATGGAGTANSISGASVTYSAGGDGNGAGAAGTSDTGMGGDGNTGASTNGGKGGSGIVVLRYLTSVFSGYITTGGTKSTDGSYTVHKFVLADSGTNFVLAATSTGAPWEMLLTGVGR